MEKAASSKSPGERGKKGDRSRSKYGELGTPIGCQVESRKRTMQDQKKARRVQTAKTLQTRAEAITDRVRGSKEKRKQGLKVSEAVKRRRRNHGESDS